MNMRGCSGISSGLSPDPRSFTHFPAVLFQIAVERHARDVGNEGVRNMSPTSPDALKDRARAEGLARTFKEVDWLLPAYLAFGSILKFADAINTVSPDQRLALMRLTLEGTYDADYLAAALLGLYGNTLHVKDFAQHIDESIKAFFSGYKLVAVVAMVPVIEGIVRKMASRAGRDIGVGTRKLKVEFDHIVERERTSPNCYGERLVMLEVLRDFIRERFLESTDEYDGLNHFNRHGIVHGIYDEYGVDLNFFRLITLLDLLCFSIGMIEGGSVFAPETTPESSRLAQHYHWLQQNVSASQSHRWWRRFLNLLSGRRPPQPPLRRSTIS
jgi:hypothetical protein